MATKDDWPREGERQTSEFEQGTKDKNYPIKAK